MPASIIDGKSMALSIRAGLAKRAAELKKSGVQPGLAVILVGEDHASQVYVKMKRRACEEAGIASLAHDLPSDTAESKIISIIDSLNRDSGVHGILVQLPLPNHIDEKKILTAIDPSKDVDGFHPINVGRLALDEKCFSPCTPTAVIELIRSTGAAIAGANAVVVGRSNIVGKPAAAMLLKMDATVTICHSKTRNLAAEVGRADIVVAAIGRAGFIKGSWIKPGAVVIDVGINRLADGTLTGDVEFEAAKARASAITPVPGGVGPMTIAMLLKNTVDSAETSLSGRKGAR